MVIIDSVEKDIPNITEKVYDFVVGSFKGNNDKTGDRENKIQVETNEWNRYLTEYKK